MTGSFWILSCFILLIMDSSTFSKDGSGILYKMQATTAEGRNLKQERTKTIFWASHWWQKRKLQSLRPNRKVNIHVLVCLAPSHLSDALNTTAQTAKRTLAYRRNSC